MKYRIFHRTRYVYQGNVPIGYNRVYLSPRNCPQQECLRTQLDVTPVPAMFTHRAFDYYGNDVQYFSVQEPHDTLDITAQSEVIVTPNLQPALESSPPWEQVRDMLRQASTEEILDAYQYVFPSEFVPVSAELAEYSAPSFTPGRPILEAVVDLTHRIFTEFTYDPAATTIATPVKTVLANRRGVCQDFAHLQIACLRSMGLASRYVSGYIAPKRADSDTEMIGAQASHAWLSVFVPGHGWVDVDPTNDVLPTTEHITLAWARDYDEVSPVRGVILGGGTQTLEVAVHVTPASN